MAKHGAAVLLFSVILCLQLLGTGAGYLQTFTFPLSKLFSGPVPCPVCPKNCPATPDLNVVFNAVGVSPAGGVQGPKSITYSKRYVENQVDTQIFVTPAPGTPFTITITSLNTESGVDVINFYAGGIGTPFTLLRAVSGTGIPAKFTTGSVLAIAAIFKSNCQSSGFYAFTVCVDTAGC